MNIPDTPWYESRRIKCPCEKPLTGETLPRCLVPPDAVQEHVRLCKATKDGSEAVLPLARCVIVLLLLLLFARDELMSRLVVSGGLSINRV